MTDKEKLIDLLGDCTINCEKEIGCINCRYNSEPKCKLHRQADYLLENGVSVLPYTGLTDKNGKKIFEGDIHKYKNHLFVVKYGKFNTDGYGWHFESIKDGICERFYGDENDYVNIIGNIHDNPELLKEGVEE